MKRNTKLRLLGCTLIVAGSAMFLSLLSGCGGGDSYAQEIEKPPASLMNPAAWEIGPIMWGDNESVGVPLHPDLHPAGWSIAVPQRPRDAGHEHYLRIHRRTQKAGLSTCHTQREKPGMCITSLFQLALCRLMPRSRCACGLKRTQPRALCLSSSQMPRG